MSHPSEIRVGLIGYGLAGAAFHAPFIAVTSGLRLAWVVTSDPDRRLQLKRDHPEAEPLGHVDELWKRASELQLVVVASPNRTHVPLARSALQAALPVVVDKPLAPSSEEARNLVEEAHQRGVMLTVFQNRRWDGEFLTVRRLLREGELGQPFRFESRLDRWRPIPKPGWRERGDPQEAGGLLYDLGSHLIDQALVLLGPVVDVYAELDRRRPGVEVEDDVFLALTHRSGARSHLYASSVAAQPGPRMRLLGDRAGYLKIGADVQEQALRSGGRPGPGWGEEPPERWGTIGAGEQARPVPTEPGAYQQFYADVVSALRGEGPVPVDPSDAVAGLEIIEAARRSAAERRVIAIGSTRR